MNIEQKAQELHQNMQEFFKASYAILKAWENNLPCREWEYSLYDIHDGGIDMRAEYRHCSNCDTEQDTQTIAWETLAEYIFDPESSIRKEAEKAKKEQEEKERLEKIKQEEDAKMRKVFEEQREKAELERLLKKYGK